MIKKLVALAGAGAMLLSMASPALAHWRPWPHPHPHLGLSSDVAIVDNLAVAESNTGGNEQDNTASVRWSGGSNANAGSGSGGRSMTTGNANSNAKAVVVANTHVSCGPCARGGRRHRDYANVGNAAMAGSNTGGNEQDNTASVRWSGGSNANAGSGSGGRSMTTGNANSNAKAWVVVNTHLGGGVLPIW